MSVEQLVGPDAILVTPEGGIWHLGLVRRGRFLVTTLWFENAGRVFGESVWTARRRFVPDDLQVEIHGPAGVLRLRLDSAHTSERLSTVLFTREHGDDADLSGAHFVVQAPDHGLDYTATIAGAAH